MRGDRIGRGVDKDAGKDGLTASKTGLTAWKAGPIRRGAGAREANIGRKLA
jgi:hypothetical protein